MDGRPDGGEGGEGWDGMKEEDDGGERSARTHGEFSE